MFGKNRAQQTVMARLHCLLLSFPSDIQYSSYWWMFHYLSIFSNESGKLWRLGKGYVNICTPIHTNLQISFPTSPPNAQGQLTLYITTTATTLNSFIFCFLKQMNPQQSIIQDIWGPQMVEIPLITANYLIKIGSHTFLFHPGLWFSLCLKRILLTFIYICMGSPHVCHSMRVEARGCSMGGSTHLCSLASPFTWLVLLLDLAS